MSILELKDIAKVYGSGEGTVNALKNVSLSVNSGDFIAIVGKSGSGKSTLLNILGCIDSASSGSYKINGVNIKDFNQKKLAKLRNNSIGFILQYFGLINDYTVYQNVQVPLRYSKLPRKQHKKKIEELLKFLEIENKTNKYPSELSGGQNQRVAIARALVNDPDIILADEPTGALDKSTSNDIMNLLYTLNKGGKTIIMVTHDVELYKYCNRKIVIEDGKVYEVDYNEKK